MTINPLLLAIRGLTTNNAGNDSPAVAMIITL